MIQRNFKNFPELISREIENFLFSRLFAKFKIIIISLNLSSLTEDMCSSSHSRSPLKTGYSFKSGVLSSALLYNSSPRFDIHCGISLGPEGVWVAYCSKVFTSLCLHNSILEITFLNGAPGPISWCF